MLTYSKLQMGLVTHVEAEFRFLYIKSDTQQFSRPSLGQENRSDLSISRPLNKSGVKRYTLYRPGERVLPLIQKPAAQLFLIHETWARSLYFWDR
jgi:hypothetical protein